MAALEQRQQAPVPFRVGGPHRIGRRVERIEEVGERLAGEDVAHPVHQRLLYPAQLTSRVGRREHRGEERELGITVADRVGVPGAARQRAAELADADGELTPIGTTVSLLEEAGFEVRDVEALRDITRSPCARG